MKSAQKVNGISVSEPPKIGERPYPSPFHPVELWPKIVEIPPKSAHIVLFKSKVPQINAKLTPKVMENSIHQVLVVSLEIGTDEARLQVSGSL